jgi:4-amino-4-deoxy-L-arabinose transferase-like glycosyltransferase
LFRVFAILFLAAAILTLPIYWFGMPDGNDLPQHYRFIHTFYSAIHSGDIYPAWAGDTNLGFGDVGIRFYPPLTYYVVVLFRSVTDSWATALAGSICFWFFVSGLGLFLLAREWFSEKASLVAAVVFMAMPYHVNQVYNAGLLAEFAGLAILPYCFLFVRRTMTAGRPIDVAGLAVSYALLILTHLPMVIIGSVGLAAFGLASIERRKIVAQILKSGAALLVSLAASSFYWVRMVAELHLVRHTLPEFTDRTYDFRQNFLASILHIPSSEYSDTSLWFTDLLFAITAAMIIPAIAIFFLRRRRDERRMIYSVLVVLAVSVFISTALSSLLWENVSILQMIQFPWRFLGLISLAGSIVIAAGVDEIGRVFATRLRPLGLIAVGLVMAGLAFTAAQVIRPAAYPSRTAFDVGFEQYRTDKSCECWWPVSADGRAFPNRERASTDDRAAAVLKWTNDEREFLVREGAGGQVRVATFYYPFWTATVENEKVELRPSDDGAILINVPAQATRIRMNFERPGYEVLSRYVSLATWSLMLLAFVAWAAAGIRRRTIV